MTALGVIAFLVLGWVLIDWYDLKFSKSMSKNLDEDAKSDSSLALEDRQSKNFISQSNLLETELDKKTSYDESPPYLTYSKIENTCPLKPKMFGFGTVEWSIQSASKTVDSVVFNSGLFSDVVKKSQGKLQLLIVSLQCAAYYVYIADVLKVGEVIHEDYLLGVKDGFLALENGKHEKVLSMLFLKYSKALQQDLESDFSRERQSNESAVLWFSKSSTVFKQDLEEFYTKERDGLVLDNDPMYLLFILHKIDEHGFHFLTDFLFNTGLSIVE